LNGQREIGRDTLNLVITKKTIQKYVCPKCKAKSGESCGHRKDKSRSHHARMELAQKKEKEKLFYKLKRKLGK
tara:strand:+ start:627 stop:845 length:219 start_codon:yes stop_codon:yes gene_type:complete